MSANNLRAFTLVELIVVITIIGILSTVGFISYTSYLTGARDTNRNVQLSELSNSLQMYSAQKKLPLPDNYIEITADGETITYQGELGAEVMESIGYKNGGKDPKDGSYYSYYITKSKRSFQIMAMMEEQAFVAQTGNSLKSPLAGKGIIPQSHAVDYSERYPKIIGSSLGILTNRENTPLEQLGLGSFDIINDDMNQYISYISPDEIIDGASSNMSVIIPNANCRRIKQVGAAGENGVYTINPGGTGHLQIYCDMQTAGGGWTLIDNIKKGVSEEIDGRTLGTVTNLSETKGVLLPDYDWGINPQLMVKSENFVGDRGEAVFNVLSDLAKVYPTSNNLWSHGNRTGHFSIANLNGNPNNGLEIRLFEDDYAYGAVWIGSGNNNVTATCGRFGYYSGIGSDFSSSTGGCNTWVR